MASYFLSYDLNNATIENYQRLYDELEQFKAKKVLESLWFFNASDTTPEELRNHFEAFMDTENKDRIIVISASSWAWRNVISKPKNL